MGNITAKLAESRDLISEDKGKKLQKRPHLKKKNRRPIIDYINNLFANYKLCF